MGQGQGRSEKATSGEEVIPDGIRLVSEQSEALLVNVASGAGARVARGSGSRQ